MKKVDKEQFARQITEKCRIPLHETYFFGKYGVQRLLVYEGVISPESSLATRALCRFLYDKKNLYEAKNSLDLGCGSGILAIIMAKNGARHVVASDISSLSVSNTIENIRLNSLDDQITALESNLFTNISGSFDVVVFNCPAYNYPPSLDDPLSIAIFDDGSLLSRFLEEVPKYINKAGRIILTGIELTGFDEVIRASNPRAIAEEMGFRVEILRKTQTDCGKRFVYVFNK